VRFLLYNIRYCAGSGLRFHLPLPYAGYLKHTGVNLESIVSFIKSIQPDIVGLIEVDEGSFRTARLSQAEAIARELDFFYIVESKYGVHSVAQKVPVLNKQGNALLARQKIVNYRFHYFNEGMKRLVIEACLDEVTVFLVHLSLTFRKRQNQLERLFQLIRTVRGPVIVAGDFNVLWGDRELELFLAAAGLQNANNQGRPSHPSHAPRRQLDYILHSAEIEVNNFYVPSVQYSDHAPLVCDFEVVKSDETN